MVGKNVYATRRKQQTNEVMPYLFIDLRPILLAKFLFPLSPLNTKWDKLALDLSIPCEPEMRIYF